MVEYIVIYMVTHIKLKRVIEFYVASTHKIQLLIVILYGSPCIFLSALATKSVLKKDKISLIHVFLKAPL